MESVWAQPACTMKLTVGHRFVPVLSTTTTKSLLLIIIPCNSVRYRFLFYLFNLDFSILGVQEIRKFLINFIFYIYIKKKRLQKTEDLQLF